MCSSDLECPTGSGRLMTLKEVAQELAARLSRIFLPDGAGRRPCHAGDRRYAEDPYWQHLVLFHEYFHGDTGRGVGASHQTGWTALVVRCLETAAQARAQRPSTKRGAERPRPLVARAGMSRRRAVVLTNGGSA